jgi:ParB-like chromosome segregation protein Spo0J
MDSIESLRQVTVEVVDLDIELIEPDPANPNELDPPTREALKREIDDNGFVQPVVVRPHQNRWLIIDGQHRWEALKELGHKTVPCVVDDAGEDEARMRLLTLNRLRGSFDLAKLSDILAELASEMSEDELRERLAIPAEDFQAILDMEAPEEDEEAIERIATALTEMPEELNWSMPLDDAAIVEEALETLTANGERNRAQAIIYLLAGGAA